MEIHCYEDSLLDFHRRNLELKSSIESCRAAITNFDAASEFVVAGWH